MVPLLLVIHVPESLLSKHLALAYSSSMVYLGINLPNVCASGP